MVDYPPLVPTIDANNKIYVPVPADYYFGFTRYLVTDNLTKISRYEDIKNHHVFTISCTNLETKKYIFKSMFNLEDFFINTFSKEQFKNNIITNFTITYKEENIYPFKMYETKEFVGKVFSYTGSPPVTNFPQMYEYIMKSIQTPYPSIVPTFNISTQQITINHPSNYDFDFSLSVNFFEIPNFIPSLTKNTTIEYTFECTNNKSVIFLGNSILDVNVLCSALSINLNDTTLVEKIKLSYIEVDNTILGNYKRLKTGIPPPVDCTEITDFVNITKLNNSITEKSHYPWFSAIFDKTTQKITVSKPNTYVFNAYYIVDRSSGTPIYTKVSNTDANITYTIECSTTTTGNTIPTTKNYTYAEIKSIVLNTLITDLNIDFTNTDLVTIKLKYSETKGSEFFLTKIGDPKDTICTELTNFVNCKKKALQLNNLPFLALYKIMNKESKTNRENGSTYNTLSEFINSTTDTTIPDVQILTKTYLSLHL